MPFVSGTTKIIKNTPNVLIAANIQNVCPIPIDSTIMPKVFVSKNAKIQLKNPEIDPPIRFRSFENISPSIIQGTGPNPSDIATIKIDSAVKGNHPIFFTLSMFILLIKKYNPIKLVHKIIDINEIKSNVFLPNLSTTNVEKRVEAALIVPRIIVQTFGEMNASAA